MASSATLRRCKSREDIPCHDGETAVGDVEVADDLIVDVTFDDFSTSTDGVL